MMDGIAQCTQMMNMMGGTTLEMMGAGSWWASPWYWFGWVWILAILVLITLVVIWTIQRSGRLSAETPLAILKRRYARGEISLEQFEAMKRQVVDGIGSVA